MDAPDKKLAVSRQEYVYSIKTLEPKNIESFMNQFKYPFVPFLDKKHLMEYMDQPGK